MILLLLALHVCIGEGNLFKKDEGLDEKSDRTIKFLSRARRVIESEKALF